MNIRPLMTALTCTAAIGSGAVAGERTPVEPIVVLQDLVDAYRAGPTAERVVVRVTNEARQQEESILLVIDPAVGALIEFGEIVAWVDQDQLRIVHRLDERGYYEQPRLGALREMLQSVLPPLPLPQLALAFDDGSPAELELLEYAPNVRWLEAYLDAGDDPLDVPLQGNDDDDPRGLIEADADPVAVLRGVGDRSAITIEMDPQTSRLRRMEVVIDGGAATIELLITPVPAEPIADLAPALARRLPVASISELRPRAGKIEVGDPLPDLRLPSTVLGPPAAIQSAGAIFMFRGMHEAVASALVALRALRDAQPEFALWSALMIDPLDGQLNFRFADALEWIDPDPTFYSVSPAGTIDRFAAGAWAVIVVVDADQVVRAIIDLAQFMPPGIPERVEHADPVDEITSAIRAQVRQALDLDER